MQTPVTTHPIFLQWRRAISQDPTPPGSPRLVLGLEGSVWLPCLATRLEEHSLSPQPWGCSAHGPLEHVVLGCGRAGPLALASSSRAATQPIQLNSKPWGAGGPHTARSPTPSLGQDLCVEHETSPGVWVLVC